MTFASETQPQATRLVGDRAAGEPDWKLGLRSLLLTVGTEDAAGHIVGAQYAFAERQRRTLSTCGHMRMGQDRASSRNWQEEEQGPLPAVELGWGQLTR